MKPRLRVFRDMPATSVGMAPVFRRNELWRERPAAGIRLAFRHVSFGGPIRRSDGRRQRNWLSAKELGQILLDSLPAVAGGAPVAV